MTDEIFDTILKRVHEERISVEKFVLHLNGEPFTDSKLIQRIQRLHEEFPNTPIWFTSNFSLPDEKMITQLISSGLDTITISLNSADAEEYKDIMGGLDYERTLRNVECLLRKNKEAGSPVHIRISIVDTGIPEKIDLFKKRFATKAEVRIIHLGKWIEKDAPVGLKNNKKNLGACADLNEQICILSNGDYALCCFDAEGHVGANVKDVPLLDAFYSESYTNLRMKLIDHGRKGTICENCFQSY